MTVTAAGPSTARETDTPVDHVDVLIVGAGLSGIGAARHLQDKSPGKSYAILEARDAIGGTWDLFRYPGIRSDSDMHTLGYRVKPWTEAKAIADGPSILEYVRQEARDHDIERIIRFNHKVVRIEWSSDEAQWTVHAERTDSGNKVTFTCNFLYCCSGYYSYDQGYSPDFPGADSFAGQIIHPQHWPEDLDYEGKRVVVIGSGATAVTLVPAMTDKAAHVTMLQRTPTYIVTVPGEDPLATAVRKVLPDRYAYPVVRWKNVALQSAVYRASRRWPRHVAKLIREGVRRQLPEGFDVDKHFRPPYNPWDQRMCVIPDGDLFRAISDGSASVVTDHIETFTETGIKLKSGEEIEADIIVTATGLNLVAFGGMEIVVDGDEVNLPDTMAYRAIMLSGIPNFAYALGYTNASWTLKADLASEYVARLINHMDAKGYSTAVPERDPDVDEELFMDFQAGYVLRSLDKFPKQGAEAPWKVRQNYPRDLLTLRHGSVTEQMQFS